MCPRFENLGHPAKSKKVAGKQEPKRVSALDDGALLLNDDGGYSTQVPGGHRQMATKALATR